MKRTNMKGKLALGRETLIALTRDELAGLVGGQQAGSVDDPNRQTGCSLGLPTCTKPNPNPRTTITGPITGTLTTVTGPRTVSGVVCAAGGGR